MAINPKHDSPNNHSLYLARTGEGKTTALKQSPMLSPRPTRLIAWDPGKDHQLAARVDTLAQFYPALLGQAKAGRINLGITPDVSRPEDFALLCQMVWQILDGSKQTVFIVEEAAAVQPSIGKAGDAWGALVREGRKFGLVLLVTTQRAQEIDKTIFSQVGNLYVGPHARYDAERISRYVGVEKDRISTLETGQYWHITPGADEPELVKFKKI